MFHFSTLSTHFYTLWKLRNFTATTLAQKFRQISFFTFFVLYSKLIWRKKLCVEENFSFFHTFYQKFRESEFISYLVKYFLNSWFDEIFLVRVKFQFSVFHHLTCAHMCVNKTIYFHCTSWSFFYFADWYQSRRLFGAHWSWSAWVDHWWSSNWQNRSCHWRHHQPKEVQRCRRR